MKYEGKNRDLVYWLFFEIYDQTENVSRQIINKKFCMHFTGKTDDDVDEALKFLTMARMISVTNDGKEIIRITSQGGQVIQKLFRRLILDKIDLDFFTRYNNGVEANYLKYYSKSKINEQDPTSTKVKAALIHIQDFLAYLDAIRAFCPHIRDLFNL